MKFDELYESKMTELTEKKWLKDIKIRKGKMHQLLGIPEDKQISDVYSSGKKLAADLVKATGGDKKKAAGMLAIPANADKTNNVFDAALKAIKNV